MLDFKDEKRLEAESGVRTWGLQSIPLNLRCFFKHCQDAESKGKSFSCDQECKGGKPKAQRDSESSKKNCAE